MFQKIRRMQTCIQAQFFNKRFKKKYVEFHTQEGGSKIKKVIIRKNMYQEMKGRNGREGREKK